MPRAVHQLLAALAPGDAIGNQALALDYDQDSIFRFVSDEIAYEPYPGILRGALGTLQARALGGHARRARSGLAG